MAREKPNYRLIMADIYEATGKRVLNVTEAAEYMDKTRDWCKTHLPFNGDNLIHITVLAQYFL